MLHLDPERLAALADEPATAEERSHLAGCEACAREREAHRALLRLAADARKAVAPPLSSWDAIAAQLRTDESSVIPLRRRASPSPRWRSAAAGVLLAAASAAAGRFSATYQRPATLASERDTSATFQSVAQASAVLQSAERNYQLAAAYLATQDSSAQPDAQRADLYRTRIAALDAMAGVARAAVEEAPHDPVINQYYLSTLTARQVALHQLGSALPQGVRLTGF